MSARRSSLRGDNVTEVSPGRFTDANTLYLAESDVVDEPLAV